MAIWQYTFEVIPVDFALRKESSNLVNVIQYNLSEFWKLRSHEAIWFEPLTQTLRPADSWCENILIYGQEASTCIKLILENSKVAEVIVRIDYREEYSAFISTLIEFCALNSLALLDENFNIVPLNALNINALIENSPQYHKLKSM
jgi:hypothetical protein